MDNNVYAFTDSAHLHESWNLQLERVMVGYREGMERREEILEAKRNRSQRRGGGGGGDEVMEEEEVARTDPIDIRFVSSLSFVVYEVATLIIPRPSWLTKPSWVLMNPSHPIAKTTRNKNTTKRKKGRRQGGSGSLLCVCLIHGTVIFLLQERDCVGLFVFFVFLFFFFYVYGSSKSYS